MAAQESPRPSNQREQVAAAPSCLPMRKAATLGADPEDMVLLREKLNQIAVGRRYAGDNQLDHMDDSGGEEDFARRRRASSGGGHFRAFLPTGDRPSTPPSSPQPRDVLRKQLRLKSHTPRSVFYTPQRSLGSEDNNSDTASDEPLDGMCVDAIEISPLPEGVEDLHGLPTHATVRLSVPEHLRVRPSSYSTLTKCPEGFRKRKSVHRDDKDLEIDGHSVVAPLKKVSSQVNVLSATTTLPGTGWDDFGKAARIQDEEMEDVGPDPSDSPPS